MKGQDMDGWMDARQACTLMIDKNPYGEERMGKRGLARTPPRLLVQVLTLLCTLDLVVPVVSCYLVSTLPQY